MPTVAAYPSPQDSGHPHPIATPQVEWQRYTNPAGQFSVSLPPDWDLHNEDGGYCGADGFFKSAYLPEMGFMDRSYRVCERLANSPQGAGWKPQLNDLQGLDLDSCRLVPYPEMELDAVRIVIRYPGAEPDQRYFYLEADARHIDAITASLVLLDATSEPVAPFYPTGPLSPEDEAFWAVTAGLPPGWIVEEYALVEAAQDSPPHMKGYVPAEVRQRQTGGPGVSKEDKLAQANALLAPFGYSLKAKQRQNRDQIDLYELYYGEELLVDRVRSYGIPSLSASGEDFVMVVDVLHDRSQLVRKDSLDKWGTSYPEMLLHQPIFYGEELLIPYFVGWRNQVQVRHGNQTIYSFTVLALAGNPLNVFWAWDDHWAMEVHGFLVQDGDILNETLGYEEIFDWQIIDGKPFYFFRKGPRVGISYDGQILPLSYDGIYHYGCCGYGMFNPMWYGDTYWFYALDGGWWYYVGLGVGGGIVSQ